jgi:hypothetical protein
LQAWRRRKLRPSGLDVPLQVDDLAMKLAVAPEREGVAICVDEVRERLQLIPLCPVVASLNLFGSEPLPGALTSMKPTRALLTFTA